MHKKNVVLLGGSNSVMTNGLQKGLKEGIKKLNTTTNKKQKNLEFYNLALGASSSLQNLYELKRDKNKTILENAKLIISESNVNDSWSYNNSEIYGTIESFFTELSCLDAKILIIILPFFNHNSKVINQIHKKLALKFNFNIIDMNNYYEKFNLIDFSFLREQDGSHQFDSINRQLGRNIIANMEKFLLHNINNSTSNFKICKVEVLENLSNKNIVYNRSNSAFKEKCIRLSYPDLLKFPSKYEGLKLIGYHSWTTEEDTNIHISSNWIERRNIASNVLIYNEKNQISLKPCLDNIFVDIYSPFYIDKNTYIKIDKSLLSYCDFIAFFLAYPKQDIDYSLNFEELKNTNIEIPKKYNFNHLIPPIELYKEIIDEYYLIINLTKLTPLQNQIIEKDNQIITINNEKTNLQAQINQLQNTLNSLPIKKQLEISSLEQDLINKKLQTKQLEKQLNIVSNDTIASNDNKITLIYSNSAKSRIQNQLSYKLGQAMIVNSKSLLGYIRMPFVLSYIKDKHKQEKKCFTYKLGEALIKANKTWYKGGYVRLIFKDIPKLKKKKNISKIKLFFQS